ncbi:hypothetical protein FA13DRAFT_1725571 [Coprinellus micaceus]|uniref:Uncharacterized protein n=1 Tax=Coprinellus micaceus TaxID=71717 RepID=A0A4Y7TVC9_COPMI|nr:hypothetical protein FA13DRAFT_1740867 [Coprinellus micaceus]TEB24426.1 hypothetical protein FA13DRAFT_1739277 [Coprinellus micaceus]TEB37941.1 hypothetical protein FA13DRAFT_1725571 [Coprinellus micaceus]
MPSSQFRLAIPRGVIDQPRCGRRGAMVFIGTRTSTIFPRWSISPCERFGEYPSSSRRGTSQLSHLKRSWAVWSEDAKGDLWEELRLEKGLRRLVE